MIQEGERNSIRGVNPATDGTADTGGTGQFGYGVRRLGESF